MIIDELLKSIYDYHGGGTTWEELCDIVDDKLKQEAIGFKDWFCTSDLPGQISKGNISMPIDKYNDIIYELYKNRNDK